MATHGLSQADLARQSGIDGGFLSRILSNPRMPGINACIGIAKVLGVSVDEVARHIRPGELPSITPDRELENDLLHQFRTLNRAGRKRVVDYARYQRLLEQGRTHLVVAEQQAEYSLSAGLIDELGEDQRWMISEIVRALAAVKKRDSENTDLITKGEP